MKKRSPQEEEDWKKKLDEADETTRERLKAERAAEDAREFDDLEKTVLVGHYRIIDGIELPVLYYTSKMSQRQYMKMKGLKIPEFENSST